MMDFLAMLFVTIGFLFVLVMMWGELEGGCKTFELRFLERCNV